MFLGIVCDTNKNVRTQQYTVNLLESLQITFIDTFLSFTPHTNSNKCTAGYELHGKVTSYRVVMVTPQGVDGLSYTCNILYS